MTPAPDELPSCEDIAAPLVTHRLTRFQRLVVWLTLSSFVAQPVLVSAQVVAATGANTPQVGAAANGVPVVQIVAPSSAGVSHNRYQQFDVTSRGVVLNNSQVVVQTQQAGFIAGNPALAGGAARIILNEVTSNLPSNLRGFTEVGGNKAEVIIANPNGITCDGCGFINTSRGVLTTGTPAIGTGGSLDAFRVTSGAISVEGSGLNGSNRCGKKCTVSEGAPQTADRVFEQRHGRIGGRRGRIPAQQPCKKRRTQRIHLPDAE